MRVLATFFGVVAAAGVMWAGYGVAHSQPASSPTTLLNLDGGAVIVQRGSTPTMPRSTAVSLFHASVSSRYVLGRVKLLHAYHGEITVRSSLYKGIQQRPGWVITYQTAFSIAMQQSACPSSSKAVDPTLKFSPSRLLAFIVTDDRSSAASYQGTGIFDCPSSDKPQVRRAMERRSIAWTLVSRAGTKATLRYTLPTCGILDGPITRSDDTDENVQLDVKVPIAAIKCGPPNVRTLTVDLYNAKIRLHHAPIGVLGTDHLTRLLEQLRRNQ